MRGFLHLSGSVLLIAVMLTAWALYTPAAAGQLTPTPRPSFQAVPDELPRQDGPFTVAVTLDVTPLFTFVDALTQEDVYGLTHAVRIVQHIIALRTAQSETSAAIAELGGSVIGQNQWLVTRLVVSIDGSQIPLLTTLPHVNGIQIVPESSGNAPDIGRPISTDEVSQ